jgi:coenzyme F420 biosynthesis associated uncharacterized protein
MAPTTIDWVAAEWLAARLAGSGSERAPDFGLDELAREAERHVVAYTGLQPAGPLPPPEAIGRREWIQSNISFTRQLLDPVLAAASAEMGKMKPGAKLWLEAVSSFELALMLGFMAQRILGQYEIVLLDEPASADPPRLLFVLPNLVETVGKLEVDEQEFVTWVTLHEVTHAVQFGGVPWLQKHLAELVQEMLKLAQERLKAPRRLRVPSRAELARVAGALRRGDMVGALAGDQERALIDRIQAVMAVIEGHAEHVMDAVGVKLLPSLPELRAALDGRRTSQSLMTKTVMRLLGFEMKLSQYKRGKVFCDEIVAQGGTDALLYLFSAPEALPTLAEVGDPGGWLARTAPARAR